MVALCYPMSPRETLPLRGEGCAVTPAVWNGLPSFPGTSSFPGCWVTMVLWSPPQAEARFCLLALWPHFIPDHGMNCIHPRFYAVVSAPGTSQCTWGGVFTGVIRVPWGYGVGPDTSWLVPPKERSGHRPVHTGTTVWGHRRRWHLHLRGPAHQLCPHLDLDFLPPEDKPPYLRYLLLPSWQRYCRKTFWCMVLVASLLQTFSEWFFPICHHTELPLCSEYLAHWSNSSHSSPACLKILNCPATHLHPSLEDTSSPCSLRLGGVCVVYLLPALAQQLITYESLNDWAVPTWRTSWWKLLWSEEPP